MALKPIRSIREKIFPDFHEEAMLDKLKTNISRYGAGGYIFYLCIRLVNKLTYCNVVVGMTLTKESLVDKYLETDPRYEHRFLSDNEIREFAKNSETDLPQEFLNEALPKGDRCYAILDDGRLAAYGWYSTKPTVFEDGLELHFNPDYVYMYRGFTHPDYRGQRLHAVGMEMLC